MNPPPLFVHLRVHSAYSLAEGMLKIDALIEAVHGFGQPAVAMTDSFNCFGALEFAEKASEQGIQPIHGVQVMLCDDAQNPDNAKNDGAKNDGEALLLVQNEAGWRNLSGLISHALLADRSPPAISIEALAEHSTGLILLTGGVRQGFIAGAVAEGQYDLARNRLELLKGVFADRLYIELQRHNTPAEMAAENTLIDLAYDMGLPLVATNDCYFLERGDAPSHSVLLCIAQSTTLDDDNRRIETPEHYLKSSTEMVEVFADLPEAIANTVVIAQRCAYRVPRRAPILPTFPTPDGLSEAECLRQNARSGLVRRFASPAFDRIRDDEAKIQEYKKRLEAELDMIIAMGFPGYFLIVADFIAWAKKGGIAVGPGRGSGAGSLVAYALTITDLDPLKWGLLFERFLNPDRISMPDFDIDFCQDRRDEVIAYVGEKYGQDRVAQIITFGSLQARAAVRDVGRVLGMPYSQVDRIAKLIPNNPANPTTLNQALSNEIELRRERDSDPEIAQLIDIAVALEGLYRHASTHAAGLVISDRPLPELVPLYRDPRSAMAVTQFNMKWVESAGLVKFDFLGLKTLTVIQNTLALIHARGIDLSLDALPLDDERAFAMLSAGDTVGVFQLESSGMRDVLRGLKPDRFEDIIAVVALYRPGPIENIPHYIARKHGKEKVEYMHPTLAPILAETYGIMIYQEQVQQAAVRLAGYSLGGADILRRAMGKKDKAEMDSQREAFIDGAKATQGIEARLGKRIFDTISSFAGYGFNKSHAAAYALIAWQTAWLKAHYRAEFLASTMTLDAGNTDKLAVFHQDCGAHGIAVLPPDVNASNAEFSVEAYDGGYAIRYGLGAIRQVGMEAMRQLVAIRNEGGQFTSIDDFATRLAGVLSKRFLENLIKAGALDCLESNRNRLLQGVDALIAFGASVRRDRHSTQENLFTGDDSGAFALTLPEAQTLCVNVQLENELEALGLYVSAHPMDRFEEKLNALGVVRSNAIEAAIIGKGNGASLNLAGVVKTVRRRQSKKGRRFAIVQMSDAYGVFEVTIFAETLASSQALLQGDAPLLVIGEARMAEGVVRITASSFQLLEKIASKTTKTAIKTVELTITDAHILSQIADYLKDDGTGLARLKIIVQSGEKEVVIDIPTGYRLSQGLRTRLKSMAGVAKIKEIY